MFDVEYGDPAPPAEMLKYLASLCRAYRGMAAPLVTPAVMDDLRAELMTLHEVAGEMPPTIWRQPLHYMQHFTEHIELFGSTCDVNMWTYESMFGHLKGLLKSRKDPISNVLNAWGVGFALRAVTSRLHHTKHMRVHGNPPAFTPNNRSRMDKDITLGGQRKVAQILDATKRQQVKAWCREQATYAEMARLHGVALAHPQCNTGYARLPTLFCLHPRSRTSSDQNLMSIGILPSNGIHTRSLTPI